MPAKHSHYALKWRSPETVRRRHDRIIEYVHAFPPLTLMQIALAVFEEFGNPETRKPMDHTTVMHHARNWCKCETLRAHEQREAPPA